MKKCKSCGAVQSDDRGSCIDCGALLGASLNTEDEKAERAALDETLENQAIHAEDMRVGAREIVLSVITAAAVAAAVLLLLRGDADREQCGFAWTATVSGAAAILHLLFPRFFWELEQIRHRLWNAWEPASPHAFAVGWVLKLLFCAAAVFFAAAAWIGYW